MAPKSTIPTPLAQRLRRARVGAIPFVVWILGVLLSMKLWLAGPTPPTYVGLATAPEHVLAAPIDGEVEHVLVAPFQYVEAGEPVASMNDARIEASIRTARAELAHLSAEARAQRAALVAADLRARRDEAARHASALSIASLEYPAELRAFHADEADLDRRVLETRLAITTSELEADRIELAVNRSRAMLDDALRPRSEFEDLEKRLLLERARAAGLREFADALHEERDAARARRRELTDSYQAPPTTSADEVDLDAQLAGWRSAVAVQERELDELALLRDAYILRAPATGYVAELGVTPRRFVLAGALVLVVAAGETNEVSMWVAESAAMPPAVGDRVVVSAAVGPAARVDAESIVQAIGPRVELLPERLWRDPRQAEYGRACRVGPVASLGLTPGERVRIDPVASTP